MMENNSVASPLVGSEIHGFHTMADLDVVNMMEEAKSRWLRPNEIHAVLCNHKYFIVNVKPKNLPKSGTVVLFDRKMLRNFRKDGYNWKKKNDGKTVKEAHEHLKVGNDERIHVYYAHGEDNPTFVRRCYWLLDKSLENIVLVHYRETRELQGSPSTSGNSNSGSGLSELPGSWPLSQEFESALDKSFYTGGREPLGRQDSLTTKKHALTLHEINTLDWDDLLVPDGYQKQIIPQGKTECFEQPNQYGMISYEIGDNGSSRNVCTENTNGGVFPELPDVRNAISYNTANDLSSLITNAVVQSHGEDSSRNLCQNGLQSQDSFGKWMSNIIADAPGSADDQTLETSNLNENQSLTSLVMDNHHPHALNEVFNITDVSPAWALSTEETKILVVGFFNEGQQPIGKSKFYLSCGDSILPVEIVQTGVFRSLIPPQTPGLVNLYMTFDGHTPISQVLSFQFRAPALPSGTVSLQQEPTREEFQLQMRLAHLLFTSSKLLTIFSSKLSQNALKEAEAFAKKTSHITNGWMRLNKMIRGTNTASPLPKDSLFEVILQNRLREWLLEEVIVGCQKTERDAQGQGVIHLCAILGYTWAIYPYSCSGLSLDYRDKSGWTALHWAAYYGREKMVAVLLSAGAKPNLVTDPTSENPGGCTAADLASKNGHDGLAAYLAEKGLVAQFNDMTLAGNVSGSLQTTGNDTINMGDFSEEESYLKDTLTAYRTAADAAARIQASFREHSFKVRKKAIESSSPETEARNIIAAMKIQHAFRNYETRKKIQAAARIQNGFRTWKIRKNFLNTRRQVIKIQAYFRAYQARKQYRKIIWSVGVLEKAILRWRQRGKGFRGLQVEPSEDFMEDPNQESDAEEDFFQASRKQAEDRVERSVVRVQAMFRSRRAQEEYRRMKLEHNQATLDYEELRHPDIDMERGNG